MFLPRKVKSSLNGKSETRPLVSKDKCGSHMLCENLCWMFDSGPEDKLGPFCVKKSVFFLISDDLE